MEIRRLILAATVLFSLVACNETKKQENMAKGGENEVVKAILDRRSIRAYKPQQVEEGQLDTIVQCAINAPSALNKQSWQVRVVQNAELLNAINNRFVENAKGKKLEGSAAKAQEPGFSVFHGAPTLIVVARDKSNDYSAVDCGLLAQNILLSAQSMNIGTCVIGNMARILNDPNSKDFLEAMQIPDTYEVVFGIALGYKNESPEAKPRDITKVQYVK